MVRRIVKSCDEVVIARLDLNCARVYGKTLLNSMASAGKYKESLAAVTLNESKELLKKRLGAIMGFKKKTVFIRIFTAVFTLLFCLAAGAAGVYAMPSTALSQWK